MITLYFHACLTVMCAAPCSDLANGQQPFSVEASVLAAVEGGPVIIHSTLTYHGKQDINGHVQFTYDLKSPTKTSGAWKLRQVISLQRFPQLLEEGAPSVKNQMPVGFVKKETVPIDIFYDAIAPGEATLNITCTIRDGGNAKANNPTSSRLIASLSRALKIDVKPATAATIELLCKQLNAQLDDPRHSKEDVDMVLMHLISTSRRQFRPLALRLLDDPLAEDVVPTIVDRVLDDQSNAEQNKVMREYLFKTNPRAAAAFFCHWGSDEKGRTLLPSGAFATLRDAPNLWVRSMLYISCVKECDRRWIEQLLLDLRQYKPTMSDAEIQPYLIRLNDDSFRMRLSAERELVAMQEPVLAPLRKAALDVNNSVDVSAAIARVIKRIEEAQPSYLEGEAMRYVYGVAHSNRNFEANQILKALASNGSNAWVSRKARSNLNELSRLSLQP